MLSTTSFVELAALFSLFTTSIAAPAKVEKRTARESTVEGKDLTANQGTVTTVLMECKTALRMKNIRIAVFMHVAYHVSANHMTRTT